MPFGILAEDSGQLPLTFGSSVKTSEFLVDSLQDWWTAIPAEQQAEMTPLHLQVDHGPESSGQRTQVLQRLVAFADDTRTIIQFLYDPPYHSQYHPLDRGWGLLEQHGNGTLLVDTQTLLEGAKSMTWKGIRPIVHLSRVTYRQGISLSKKALQEIEARWERNPLLPTWDILIRPA